MQTWSTIPRQPGIDHAPESGPRKRCQCCDRLHSPADWRALPLVGHQDFDGDEMELRNCPCGTTLVIAFKLADV